MSFINSKLLTMAIALSSVLAIAYGQTGTEAFMPSSTSSNYPSEHPSSPPTKEPSQSPTTRQPSMMPSFYPSSSSSFSPVSPVNDDDRFFPDDDRFYHYDDEHEESPFPVEPPIVPVPQDVPVSPVYDEPDDDDRGRTWIILGGASALTVTVLIAKKIIGQGLLTSRPTVRNSGGQFVGPNPLLGPLGGGHSRSISLDINDIISDLAPGGGESFRSKSNIKQDSAEFSVGSLPFPISANSISSSPWSSNRSIVDHHDINLDIRRVLHASSSKSLLKRNDVASFPIVESHELLYDIEEQGERSRHQSEMSDTMNETAKDVQKDKADDLDTSELTDR